VGATGIEEEEEEEDMGTIYMRNYCDQNGSKGPNIHADNCEREK
jgi:hypothetical protein